MLTVRILKNWNWPDILRQTPGGKGVWDGILYETKENPNVDYILALSPTSSKIYLKTYKENIWLFIQEPPNEFFKIWHKAPSIYQRVFTTDPTIKGARYETSQPAIPWFINKTYDELKNEKIPEKKFELSCITSLKRDFIGHRSRLNFINDLKQDIKFDLIATYDYYLRENKQRDIKEIKSKLLNKGFTKVVKNKWEALAPYKYSLIVENYSGPNYWSEKLADSFLAWTMPIYYGCTNIESYFPIHSLVKIDINDSLAPQKIKDITQSDIWKKYRKYVEEARSRILDKYQFFPHITNYIKDWEKRWEGKRGKKRLVMIPKGISLSSQVKVSILSRIERVKTRIKRI